MQRKKQVGECWVCVIFFARVVVLCIGGGNPRCGGLGATPIFENFFLPRETCHIFRWFFGTWFFADGFLFPVKELGLLTNPSHWVRPTAPLVGKDPWYFS
jgi:hypothetical protein